MKNLFSLFSHESQEEPPEHDVDQLAWESALKSLELEISDRDETIARLKNELARLHENQQLTTRSLTDSSLKNLFEELSPQISQLQTQRYLVLDQGKPLPPRYIFTILAQMQDVLAKFGLEIADNVGEIVPFNPDHHTPLSLENRLSSGDSVVIRFAGLSFRGQRIHNAGVEPVEETL